MCVQCLCNVDEWLDDFIFSKSWIFWGHFNTFPTYNTCPINKSWWMMFATWNPALNSSWIVIYMYFCSASVKCRLCRQWSYQWMFSVRVSSFSRKRKRKNNNYFLFPVFLFFLLFFFFFVFETKLKLFWKYSNLFRILLKFVVFSCVFCVCLCVCYYYWWTNFNDNIFSLWLVSCRKDFPFNMTFTFGQKPISISKTQQQLNHNTYKKSKHVPSFPLLPTYMYVCMYIKDISIVWQLLIHVQLTEEQRINVPLRFAGFWGLYSEFIVTVK